PGKWPVNGLLAGQIDTPTIVCQTNQPQGISRVGVSGYTINPVFQYRHHSVFVGWIVVFWCTFSIGRVGDFYRSTTGTDSWRRRCSWPILKVPPETANWVARILRYRPQNRKGFPGWQLRSLGIGPSSLWTKWRGRWMITSRSPTGRCDVHLAGFPARNTP